MTGAELVREFRPLAEAGWTLDMILAWCDLKADRLYIVEPPLNTYGEDSLYMGEAYIAEHWEAEEQ